MRDLVGTERERRHDMWKALRDQGGPTSVPAAVLRELGIYGGAQGVWVDKERTAPCTADGRGVSVGLLHTGRHYPDDMSEDDAIYHYPKTDRPATRDTNEVEATKNAGRLRLPVFVITQRDHTHRDVHWSWVVDWDDESRLFLIAFGDEPASVHANGAQAATATTDEEPFVPLEATHAGRRQVKSRPGQQRFKFAVFKRYGPKCAVCSVSVADLLQAAHIIPKEEYGSDDPRNGLVLCANHHLAFDAGLFAIEPGTLVLHAKPGGPTVQAMGLTMERLGLLRSAPHAVALRWRFTRWV